MSGNKTVRPTKTYALAYNKYKLMNFDLCCSIIEAMEYLQLC